MLSPIIIRALIVSGGLWSAIGVGAGLVHPSKNNLPAARAEPLMTVLNDDVAPLHKADRLALPKPQPVGIITHALIAVAPHAIEHRRDKVCGMRGRRYFLKHRHRFWRCQR